MKLDFVYEGYKDGMEEFIIRYSQNYQVPIYGFAVTDNLQEYFTGKFISFERSENGLDVILAVYKKQEDMLFISDLIIRKEISVETNILIWKAIRNFLQENKRGIYFETFDKLHKFYDKKLNFVEEKGKHYSFQNLAFIGANNKNKIVQKVDILEKCYYLIEYGEKGIYFDFLSMRKVGLKVGGKSKILVFRNEKCNCVTIDQGNVILEEETIVPNFFLREGIIIMESSLNLDGWKMDVVCGLPIKAAIEISFYDNKLVLRKRKNIGVSIRFKGIEILDNVNFKFDIDTEEDHIIVQDVQGNLFRYKFKVWREKGGGVEFILNRHTPLIERITRGDESIFLDVPIKRELSNNNYFWGISPYVFIDTGFERYLLDIVWRREEFNNIIKYFWKSEDELVDISIKFIKSNNELKVVSQIKNNGNVNIKFYLSFIFFLKPSVKFKEGEKGEINIWDKNYNLLIRRGEFDCTKMKMGNKSYQAISSSFILGVKREQMFLWSMDIRNDESNETTIKEY